MKTLFNKKFSNMQSMILSFFAVFLFIFLIIWKCSISFETNDDRIIMELFSGTITGKPDAHAAHVNYVLGKIISFLYTITKNVPWYGLFLVLCCAFSYVTILFVAIKKCRNIVEQIGIFFLGIIVIAVNVYITGVIQYTTVAGVLALTGYACLIMGKSKHKKYIIFLLFQILSILLRSESMYMVQPIGICTFVAILFQKFLDKEYDIKECIMEFLKCTGTLLIVLILSYTGNYVIGDLNQPEWKDYYEYHKLRIELVDYYGFPAYEDCKSILEKYDVTETEYEGVRRYWLFDNVLETSCMEELLELSKINHEKNENITFYSLIKKMINYVRYDNCYGYEFAVPLMYLLVIALTISISKIVNLFPIMALFTSRNIVFAYLTYRGRTPSRVVNILFVAELFLLFAILITNFAGRENKLNILQYAITTLSIIVFMFSANKSWDICMAKNANNIQYEQYMQELFDYFKKKECGILVNNDITNYYTGRVLTTHNYQDQNYLVAGGWYYNSPAMNNAVAEYKRKYDENMEVVIFSDVPGWDNSYVLELLAEKYDVGVEQTDYISIEELGLNYAIYRIKGSIELCDTVH